MRTAGILLRRAAACAGVALLGGAPLSVLSAGTAGADPATFQTYQVGAQAPTFQITEDSPGALFHPQGDGDYNYTLATADASRSYALSTLLWPGGAAGNAGSLVSLLGGPSSASALNDPVRAEATSGTPQTHQELDGAPGTTMSASVVGPNEASPQSARSATQTSGGDLGPIGSTGASTSTSSILMDTSTSKLTATSVGKVSDVKLAGGVVSIGSATSTATAASQDAATPSFGGTTLVQNMTIGGQPAYVDGSGVHVGKPGKPAPLPVQDAVNAALKGAGMSIYFTTPHSIPVGGVTYYFTSSILFFWAPPGDPSNDSFTLSIGGSAVSMGVTAGSGGGLTGSLLGGGGGGSTSPAPSGAFPPSAASPASNLTLSLPSSSAGAGVSADLGRASPRSSNGAQIGVLTGASSDLPAGLGGWWVAILLAGVLGAVFLPRVPGLFRSGAGIACPRERQP